MTDYEPTFGGQDFGLASVDGSVAPTPYAGLDEETARRQVLNRIASGEANSYSELYGGHTFSGFDDHPRVPIPITSGPNVGKYSTAAGRYQFIAPTWDDEKRRLNLPDFSPDSQDAAAWDLAQRTYRQQTGRSLLADAQGGNVNWGSLGGQWESLVGAKSGPGLAKLPQGGARDWGAQGSGSANNAPASGSASSVDPSLSAGQQMMQLRQLISSMFPQPKTTSATPAYNPWRYANPLGGPALG